MTDVAPILSVKDLSVEFPTDDGVVRAVRGISFDVRPRDVLGVVGESGCGKSVSSMAIMGLLPRSARISGSIKFHDRELIGMKNKELRQIRGRQIAMVFQDPMTAMNPVYKIGWQLGEAIKAHNNMTRAQVRERCIDLLNMVGIPQAATRVDDYPHEFSGGMRQRVMIAMAIANDPDVLIADEPTTALDVTVQAQILEMLLGLKDQLEAAIILITHDLGVVAGITDHMQVMYAGKVVESGTADDVFYEPRMPYSIGLLGSIPVHTEQSKNGGRLKPIGGAPPSLINVLPGCPFAPRCPLSDGTLCETVDPPLRNVGHGHLAACHHSDELAAMTNPLRLFSGVAE